MKIIEYKLFTEQLKKIDAYYRNLSENSANNFLSELYDEIISLDYMPYKFRKSIYYNDENIRDCIFKGYVIPYKIMIEKDIIAILAIFRENIFKP